MKMTRILPTNKKCEVWYGPKTYAEALAAIKDGGADPKRLCDSLHNGGYTGIAAKLRKECGV